MGVLEDKAQQVLTELSAIQTKCAEIARVCMMVRATDTIGEDVFEFTSAQKQLLIEHYQDKKAELATLIDGLP